MNISHKRIDRGTSMKSSAKCDGLGRDEVTDSLGDEGDVVRDNVQVTGEARSCGWAPDTALIEAVTARLAMRSKMSSSDRRLGVSAPSR